MQISTLRYRVQAGPWKADILLPGSSAQGNEIEAGGAIQKHEEGIVQTPPEHGA